MPTSPWLTSPLRPSSGTHEIMRITLLVQNGIVHSTNSSVCMPGGAHVEGQEIGDREAEQQRHDPGQQRKAQRRPVGLQCHAGVGQVAAALEDRRVVLAGEPGDQLVVAGRPETHRHDQQQRRDEEEQEHRPEKGSACSQAGGPALTAPRPRRTAADPPRGCPAWGGPALGPVRPRPRTHSTSGPCRCSRPSARSSRRCRPCAASYEPPSRTLPALASRSPFGDLMSFVGGLAFHPVGPLVGVHLGLGRVQHRAVVALAVQVGAGPAVEEPVDELVGAVELLARQRGRQAEAGSPGAVTLPSAAGTRRGCPWCAPR